MNSLITFTEHDIEQETQPDIASFLFLKLFQGFCWTQKLTIKLVFFSTGWDL